MPEVRLVGSLNRVRPEFEERYIILHKHTFPEVLRRIRKSNMRYYSIFLREGLLFSYLEYVGREYENDMKAVGDDVDTQEWWKLTDPMQDPLPGRPKTEWWANMDLLYTCCTSIKTPGALSRRIAYVATMMEEDPRRLAGEIRDSARDLPLSVASGIALNKFRIFAGYGHVCLYAEVTGNFRDNETVPLENILTFNDGKLPLHKHLKSDWQDMREVFFAE